MFESGIKIPRLYYLGARLRKINRIMVEDKIKNLFPLLGKTHKIACMGFACMGYHKLPKFKVVRMRILAIKFRVHFYLFN